MNRAAGGGMLGSFLGILGGDGEFREGANNKRGGGNLSTQSN